jgi:TfoX/Sxy family transcriptional regulator of competence genes
MTDAVAQFTKIAETLDGEVSRRQMMGCPILMREGKMVACLDDDVFAVKLGRTREEYAEALTIPGAELWSPKESHRQFTDWVGIPLSQSDVWLEWTRTAIDLADEAALTAVTKPRARRTSRPSSGGGGV